MSIIITPWQVERPDRQTLGNQINKLTASCLCINWRESAPSCPREETAGHGHNYDATKLSLANFATCATAFLVLSLPT